jgi:hypothetical protein
MSYTDKVLDKRMNNERKGRHGEQKQNYTTRDHYCLNKALRASSPAFLALVTEGLVRLFLMLPFPALAGSKATAFTFALAALAAATALRWFPPLGLLFGPLFLSGTPLIPGSTLFSFSTRLRNGLGRFSSSEKSYSGSGDEGCGTVADLLGAAAADDEGRLEEIVFDGGARADNPVGSEVDAGSPGRWTDRRMEGRRRRVGGTPADESRCCIDFDSDFARSRIEGEGGGPSTSDSSSPRSDPSSPSPFLFSKSNIFAKFKPTLGEFTNKFVSSAGVGVVRVSPVAVKTTPFIAEVS